MSELGSSDPTQLSHNSCTLASTVLAHTPTAYCRQGLALVSLPPCSRKQWACSWVERKRLLVYREGSGKSFLQEGGSRLGLDCTGVLVGQHSEHHIEREPQTRAGPMYMFG